MNIRVLLLGLLVLSLIIGVTGVVGGESKTYSGVNFPLGDRSFADQASLQPGDGTDDSNAAQAVGPPKGGDKEVSLGDGGILIARFIDNVLIDVDGPDLYIFETGPKVEPFRVEISQDGSKWTNLGTVSGQPTSLDIHGKTPKGAKFSYVRITDSKSHMSTKPVAGADIAAIGAIGSEAVNALDVGVNAYPTEGRPGEEVMLGALVFSGTPDEESQPVTGAVLSLKISPSMGGSRWDQEDTSIPGTYGGTLSIPANAPPGFYTLTITASKKGFQDGSGSCTYIVKGANALDVEVNTYPTEGRPGEEVMLGALVFSGPADEDSQPVTGAVLSLKISPSMGDSRWDQEDTSIPGTYGGTFYIPGDTPPGTYTFKVTASKKGFQDGSGSCSFTVKGVNALDVSVSSVNAEACPSDTVGLAVRVTSKNVKGDAMPVDDAVLSMSISPPADVSKWTQLDTSMPGTYGRTFNLPANVPPGTYSITVKASKKGFQDGSGSCSLTVKGYNTLDIGLNKKSEEGHPGETIRIGLMVTYVTAKGSIESADDAVLSVSASPPMGVVKWIQEGGSVPGAYYITFIIPSNATPGIYTITIKASKKGFLDDSGSLSLTVRGASAPDSRPLESVAGGIAGVAAGITGPYALAKAIAIIRAKAGIRSRPGYRPPWRRPTEIVPEPSWETIQFTHPHEEPGGTNWIDEEDPKKRQQKRQEEFKAQKNRQKWLNSLSDEDRTAEWNRSVNGQSIKDEYAQIFHDRPEFMKKVDQRAKAEAKAKGTFLGDRDDWEVIYANEQDLKAMSPEERTQYDQWLKRYESFTRRHGESNLLKVDYKKLRTSDGRYDRIEFSPTAGGSRGGRYG